MLSYTLQKYELKLENCNFKRVHQKYLMNLHHVVSKECNMLTMSKLSLGPMSRRKKIYTQDCIPEKLI